MSGFRMSLGSAAPQANDDAATFQQLLADMSGTKESIKQAKEWLLQRPDKAEVFAKAKDRQKWRDLAEGYFQQWRDTA